VATSINDLQKLFLQGPICKNFVPGKVRKAVDYVITKTQLPVHCLALEIKPRCWCLVLPVLPFLPLNGMPSLPYIYLAKFYIITCLGGPLMQHFWKSVQE